MKRLILIIILLFSILNNYSYAESSRTWFPQILKPDSKDFLPDYSYAGYKWGEAKLPDLTPTLNVKDYGAIPNDNKDDTIAILTAIAAAKTMPGTVVLRFPKGRFIVTRVLFIKRSNFVLQGSGSGVNGTTMFIPKPLKDMHQPKSLERHKDYLIKNNKRVKGKLYSLFSWMGGVIWTGLHGGKSRYKGRYTIKNGKRGKHQILLASSPSKIKAGDIVEIQWFNKEGKDSSLLRHIIGKDPVKTGVRLYESPAKPLIRQSVTITEVNGKLLIIKEPLLHDLRGRWVPVLKHRLYLKNVGFEHFRIEFPDTKYAGHHIEDGFNAFYLMDLAHSWVKDVKVHNTDAAVLSSRCKNVTIDSIVVTGRTSHYSVHVSNSYGMLTTNFKFESEALHDPSLNTGAKLCVFSNGHIKTGRLDQHCGLNHQNLFDKITVNDGSQIFRHGGAKNWYPVAGLFNTFWNITINKGLKISCKNAPGARLVGLRGVKSAIRLNYSPNAYIEGINQKGIKVPSLYHYQLGKRLK